MQNRKGRERSARELRRALVLRDVRSTFRVTIDGMRREYIREREAAQRRIAELSMERVGLRATIERQRELLAHPWRHLWHWTVGPLRPRGRKEAR